MSAVVLVHSPVVGPSTWRWVADELAERGYEVSVPGASEAAGCWQAFVDTVVAQIGHREHAVLVGHSGAGPLLPQIRQRAGWLSDALIFVDAGLPPEAGDAELMPAEFLAELQAMAQGGVLPPWSDWFGPHAMRELVPDDGRRAIISGELPRLPLSYFQDHVPMPTGWATARCGFVLLSKPYAGDAAQAASRGWPVLEQLGGHLDMVTRPTVIADLIVTMLSMLGD